MPTNISFNITLPRRPLSLDCLLHCFCIKAFTFCFPNFFQKFRQFCCFSSLNLFLLFIYPNPVVPIFMLRITFDIFILLSILHASTATFHFLPVYNSGTLSLTDWSSDCWSCNNSPTLHFLNSVTKPCIGNRHDVSSQ